MDMSVSAPDRKSYDLYLRLGERRVVWSFSDHGVTLTDDAVAWLIGGHVLQARLRDIVEVHLQLGYVEASAVASCRLRFADGSSLVITSSNSRGFQDAALDRVYVEFIHDLHARLAARGDGHIAFTSGFSEGRLQFGIVLLMIAGLFFIALPVGLLLLTGEWKLALATYTGLVLLWPLYKAIQVNAPRSYDPRHVPEELMPVRLNLPPKVDPILLDSLD
jgi:hypothetical protein